MPFTVVRMNLVDPAATSQTLSARYRAALEMAAYADDRGIDTVQTEEHHGADNNWLPSPFTFAGAVFGATRRIAVTVSAIIGPLYDPLRLAEDVAVLDLVSGGRLVTVAGIGYRPAEYEQQGVEWGLRGRLQDELLETLLKAWTGEEFTFRGRRVRVTPRPFTEPHPMLLVGGSSRAAARRAARLGLPFFPSAHLPEIEAYYNEKLAEYGTEGFCMICGGDDDAAARRRGPGPDVGRVRRALPARGADVRVLAVQGHPLGGEVGGHHRGRAACRGRLPDRDPRAVRGAGRRQSRPASAVRRDAGGRGLAQPAPVLRTGAARAVTTAHCPGSMASRGSVLCEERGSGV